MTVRVFAFDPGRTTGYCSIDVADDGRSFELLRCEEIQWEDRMASLHGIFSDVPPNSVVVVESFRLFPHKAKQQIGSQFPSVQVIGNIEAMVHLLCTEPEDLKIQEPGDIAKVAVLDEHVSRVAGSPHKIDAYRHARLYFLRHFYLNPFS